MPKRDITTLIDMQKLAVDQQRRVLAEKQKQVDELMMALATLQANLEIEKAKAAAEGGEGNFLIGPYIKHELYRQEEFQKAISRAERDVDEERQRLALLFEEMKRYEIAQEQWDAVHEAELRKREEQGYDEQAGQRHHRRREDSE